MSLSLPGNCLYSLSQDNLPPEEYERIISPNTALSRINREYEFDDRHNTGRYIINMRERQISSNQALPCGIREKEKLDIVEKNHVQKIILGTTIKTLVICN
ncbi:HNH endonuclease domain-containing protein [Yersinia pseudotuberculosis]|nr:hypothetical protein BZ19_2714 [Yersinia pseudotuberculosis str. PA3606]UFA60319.1 Uncharacterized protein YP598_0692 [Yersinia pseudotuberculosis]CNI18333.1 HNH endonuclease domain-containing protein [Yersinia pseudotuberculosis]CNI49576.1 HNH endonuclease domain-containing protein [Yersinia pseudotuberculosis]